MNIQGPCQVFKSCPEAAAILLWFAPWIKTRPCTVKWKRQKRKAMETKSFRLTFVDGDDNFEDMWEIPIDLSQLQESHGLYKVVHVVTEIERQLGGGDTKLVATDIKGNRIRDIPATRGMLVYFAL